MTVVSHDLVVARDAAQAGAQVVTKQFGLVTDAHLKDDSNSLVTSTDKEAEAAIIEVLRERSTYSILSEESGISREANGPRWIVDPLDGTTNFSKGLPLFAVSVALLDDRFPITGVIIDPVHHMEFYAERNRGGFSNENPLSLPPHHPEQPATLFVNHGYSEIDCERSAEVTRRLSTSCYLRQLGTTALELCYVARGAVDGFICSGDELWDFAAGVLIAEEAGCIFTDWNGQPWDGENTFVLVSRPEIHKFLVEQLQDLQ